MTEVESHPFGGHQSGEDMISEVNCQYKHWARCYFHSVCSIAESMGTVYARGHEFHVLCFLLFTELPGAPANLGISNIGPRSVTLQFRPGYDGKTSISRWQVEVQVRQISFADKKKAADVLSFL